MRAFLIAIGLLLFAELSFAQTKGPASRDGLAAAQRDVVALKLALKEKSSDDLIAAFIPASHPRRYGGYAYYYKYMANIAICEELTARGKAAESTLRANIANDTRIWEAINGPGDSIGRICIRLLDKIGPKDKQNLDLPALVGHEVHLDGKFAGPGKYADFIVIGHAPVYLMGKVEFAGKRPEYGTPIVVEGILRDETYPGNKRRQGPKPMATPKDHYIIQNPRVRVQTVDQDNSSKRNDG